MSLASVSSLNTQLLALPPTLSSFAGATQFVNVMANYMDQVQGGPTGSPGIFTYLRPPAIAAIQVLPPVNDNSWIPNFAAAIHLGTTGATLTPGTISDPVWTGSGGVDIGPVSITTLAPALAVLIAALAPVTSGNNPAMPLAQAIHDYTLAFIFQTTGIVAGVPPTLLTLTFPAQ